MPPFGGKHLDASVDDVTFRALVEFLIDEDVPLSAVELLIERGHQIAYAVDVLLKSSDDHLLAKWAHERGATIVTCNIRHFNALVVRRSYSQAGLVGLPQLRARDRLEQCIALIEVEHKQRNRVRAEIRMRNLLIKH